MFTLVVPVLIFLFLKGFSTNHYDLPYYVPLRDAVSGEVLKNKEDTVFFHLPVIPLGVVNGQEVSTQILKGKTVIVNAVELPCSDTCQNVLFQLERAFQLHQTYPELAVITFVKGYEHEKANDTVPLVAHRPDWWEFTTSDSAHHQYLKGVFHLTEKLPGQKTISPYNRFILLDRSGYIRGYYDALNPEEIDRLMVEIKILEYNRE